ncbi:CRISPR-associated helicase Cas3' [Nocardiopsis sp. CC223A]|uniref:CRISPR-associated helicase Cas3' n=1 Tax=Nocardiopsis sp. CC223A TaxID=3044051 RepID=UPI00278BFA45|nr:CRISPR-associated helicase Cas3' [Nocardiopsis sp. CC223A]
MTDTPSASAVPPLVPVLWGKTGEVDHGLPDEAWHPLLFHMIDSANVAGQIWDRYLSAAMRGALGLSPESGKALYMWLAGLHDLGKASPVHQKLSPHHYQRVHAVVPHTADCQEGFGHARLSAHMVTRILEEEEGWPFEAAQWVADVLGGHHGTFPSGSDTHDPERRTVGGEAYRQAQRYLFDAVTGYCGVDLDDLRDRIPGIGTQLSFAGAVVMADWLASNSRYFGYDETEQKPTAEKYAKASQQLAKDRFQEITELNQVWQPRPGGDTRKLYKDRFGIDDPHSTQIVVDEMARAATRPGLMVVEAPTGEGKTEAALAAAEILAERFGFNGLFFALPTQATSNSIFGRLLKKWSESQQHKPTVSLVHGKARLKKEFAELPPGAVADGGRDSLTVSSWMRGSKKALLNPIAVGTIDQLLFAGVAARYVQLRHLGLANKVVVIDEVHAYDTYMSEILHRVLHWLGWHGVPVVLLSATLPPEQRRQLLTAYSGAPKLPVEGAGYPRITWVEAPTKEQRLAWKEGDDTEPVLFSRSAATGRGSTVRLEFAPEAEKGNLQGVLEQRLKESPKANVLVLRNTVQRAQDTYDQLREQFPDFEVRLAHARFTAQDRERIDRELMDLYGPPAEDRRRPDRSIVVATQVAEQSLDVDFDLVVSDLAPIDLLLQRAGRCHRHQKRPMAERGTLTTPTLVITGYHQDGAEPPRLLGRTRRPYDHHLLYRTLAVLTHPERRTAVTVPGDVPLLIESVYEDSEIGPQSWQTVMAAARKECEEHRAQLKSRAHAVLIAQGDPEELTLAGIHPFGNDHRVPEDEEEAAHMLPVRDGADSVEVILLRRTSDGQAVTVSRTGTSPLTVPLDRTPPKKLIPHIGNQAIRLPLWLLDKTLPSCPKGWEKAPWAKRLRVLLLDSASSSRQGGRTYIYSSDTGWTPQ